MWTIIEKIFRRYDAKGEVKLDRILNNSILRKCSLLLCSFYFVLFIGGCKPDKNDVTQEKNQNIVFPVATVNAKPCDKNVAVTVSVKNNPGFSSATLEVHYDDKFLSILKDEAEKKWESDLAKYLEIESAYFKNWLDELSDLDDEELLKSMWIDTDNIDPDKMTDKEKQELIKKFRSAFGKLIDENKDMNNKLVKDLEKVTKNIRNDKFWLKEKLEKTKNFMETSNAFLDLYSESLFSLMEITLTKDENDENSDEWLAQALWLIWAAFAYQWAAQEYQTYVEEWAVNTLKTLGIN